MHFVSALVHILLSQVVFDIYKQSKCTSKVPRTVIMQDYIAHKMARKKFQRKFYFTVENIVCSALELSAKGFLHWTSTDQK